MSQGGAAHVSFGRTREVHGAAFFFLCRWRDPDLDNSPFYMDPNLLGEGCARVPAERGKRLAASHT